MSSLTKTVLKRPVAALIVVAALIIFGISSITGMDLQLIPDMDMPVMLVMTTYPGASPEDVDRLVTSKLEDGLGTLSGLKNVYSSSRENMSMAMYSYEYGTDMDKAFTKMQEAVERIKRDLPDDCNDPTIIAMDMNAMPVMMLSVDSDNPDFDLLGYVNDTVEDELKKVSDVADLSISGGNEEYIKIELIPELMKQYKLNISGVASLVAAANYTIPTGNADYGSQKLAVSATAEYKTPEQLRTIPITTGTGQIIHLSDIANVHYAVKDATSYSRYNGSENVSIGVTKVQSSSAVTLSRKVMKLIDSLNAQNPEAVISVVYDSSETIVNSIVDIAETLLLGVVITMLILFLFFGDFKGSLIVGSSMPVSLLVTFILMHFMGFSLNMITMGALVIGIGMMVDNSIVVLEMCFRKRDEDMDFMEAAYEATKQVMTSITAGTITTVVVYLPLAMMEGLSGQMFGQLGYTIVFALLASLISAVTLVPLCFFQYKPVEKKNSRVNRFLNWVGEKYAVLLRWALHKRFLVAVLAIVIFGISIFLFRFCNVELMASSDEGEVTINVTYRPGMKLDVIDAKVREIEDFVAKSPYIENYSASTNESSASGTIDAYVADDCKLKTQEIVDEWTPLLMEYAQNCEVEVSSASSMGANMGGSGATYQVSLESKDLDKLKEACKIAEDAVLKADGVISSTSSLAEAATRAEIVVDPIKAGAVGLTPKAVSGVLYSMLSGSDAMEVMIDDKEYKIRVEYPDGEYSTVNAVSNITLTGATGADVPLSDIAEIVMTDSPTTISKKDKNYTGTVTATLESAKRFEAQKAIQEIMGETFLPEGVHQVTNTMDEMMQEEFKSLITAIVTAILLVYMVMAIQFNNLRYSGMVMFCIPFALIGSILLLLVTQTTVSMVSLMGFLMLIGIVVNNGILYVDNTNLLRSEGMHAEEALIETGKSRLRPILMTTLTTILSMIPMALGVGKNGDMTKGMALVIVGGLTASTVLTLVLLPTFYMIIHKRSKDRKNKKKKKLFAKKEVEEIVKE